MFSPDIVCGDAFIEMPVSARDLYVQLAMKADDDGFISPRSTMRMLGASEDDLKVLIAKRFVLPFESGVLVIKHWLIHNLIRADLYKETLYKKEKKTLGLNEYGAYTELRDGVSSLKQVEAPKWLKERRGETRTANVPQTVPRLGQDREGNFGAEPPVLEVKEEETPKKHKPKYADARTAFSWLPNPQKSWDSNLTQLECGLLLFERGEDAVRKFVKYVQNHQNDEGFNWTFTKPSDYERKWEDIKLYAKRNS